MLHKVNLCVCSLGTKEGSHCVFVLTVYQVLRIWDTHLQVCLQRLSGMFPKGPAEGRTKACTS